jgi:hypothetical protein
MLPILMCEGSRTHDRSLLLGTLENSLTVDKGEYSPFLGALKYSILRIIALRVQSWL